MKDGDMTKAQLISELVELRQRNAELETLETEREQTEEATQQCNRELMLLSRVGRVCNSTLPLEQVLSIILEEVRRLLDASICSLWLLDPETTTLICRRATGFRYERVEGWRLALGQGLVGWTTRTGDSLIVPDTRADPRHFKDIDQKVGLELRSILSVPLRVRDKVIGAINVTDTAVDHFRPTDLTLLESLAAMAAITIDKSRLAEQAQQALSERKASEELWRRYEFIVNASQDFMTLINQDHTYEAVNEAYCQAHQISRVEIIGRSVAEVWGEEQYSTHIKARLEQCLAGNEAHRQAWFDFSTLGRRYFDVIYYPYRNPEGTVTHAVVISRDFTEAKQLEEQLGQMQKMEAIGQLAGGIAHDFNNLLTVMMGHTDLVLATLPVDSLIWSDIKSIQKTAQRAADLTHQLLAFARKQIIEPRRLNLNYLIADLEKMLRRLIRQDIELITRMRPDLGRAEIDPNQFEQLLINLVVNACDAMPTGGTLTIETANVTLDQDDSSRYAEVTPGKYVMLTVSDTGIGMTEEIKTHLFEPFFTTKEVGKGTGLGLATVYGIIKQSSGHIWVDSEPGRGTTFKIYLPSSTFQTSKSGSTKSGSGTWSMSNT